MLSTPDHPTLARVMRVTPLPDERPARGFTWGDYEDVAGAGDDDADDGWGVVQSRKPSTSSFSPPSSPLHLPPLTHLPSTQNAP